MIQRGAALAYGLAAALLASLLLAIFGLWAGGYGIPPAHAAGAAVLAIALFALALLSVPSIRLETAGDRADRRREITPIQQAGMNVSDAVARLPEIGLDEVLRTILREAQSLTHARMGALGIGTDPEVPFNPWVASCVGPEVQAAIGRTPRPRGLLGSVAREGRPVRIRSVQDHPEFAGLPPHHPPVTSLLGVPIFSRGKSAGNLYLANKLDAPEFSQDDESAVQMLAAHVGSALEISLLYQKESLQRLWLEAVLEQMPEGVVITDAAGSVIWKNEAALGMSSSARIHRPTGEPMRDEDLPIHRARTGGVTVRGVELELSAVDGDRIPILMNATPIRQGGKVDGAVAVFQDIRSQKELERLREEWASVVAHDLQQPVQVIQFSLSLLERLHRESSLEEKREIELIRTSARRLHQMIRDLTDVSRIEARRLSVHRAPVSLRAVLDEVVRQSESDREIRLEGPPGLVVNADSDRIHQILTNLVSNAVKYGAPATPITISVQESEEEFEIVVSNHGPGIAPEEMPRLFSRFARSERAIRGGRAGLGLGLYICRGLVEAHGGRIWAESTPGEITRFHFTLPRAALGPEVS